MSATNWFESCNLQPADKLKRLQVVEFEGVFRVCPARLYT